MTTIRHILNYRIDQVGGVLEDIKDDVDDKVGKFLLAYTIRYFFLENLLSFRVVCMIYEGFLNHS